MKPTVARFLTTRQLARRWMVSEATIKRWADAGHLRFSRTVGGHRRFALEEVARFQAERGLGGPAAVAAASPASATPRAGAGRRAAAARVREAAKAFLEAVLQGREGAATATLLELYLDGIGPAKIFDEVVADAMRRVGEGWHGGRLSVADEHLATRAAFRAVEAVGGPARRKAEGGRFAVCCAVEDELHDMAALCAQVVLEDLGWRVQNLGANTPFFALSEFVTRGRPQLVCVSSSTEQSALGRGADEYRQFLDAARSAGARVALGGEGFRDAGVRRRFPADLHAGSLKELVEFLRE